MVYQSFYYKYDCVPKMTIELILIVKYFATWLYHSSIDNAHGCDRSPTTFWAPPTTTMPEPVLVPAEAALFLPPPRISEAGGQVLGG